MMAARGRGAGRGAGAHRVAALEAMRGPGEEEHHLEGALGPEDGQAEHRDGLQRAHARVLMGQPCLERGAVRRRQGCPGAGLGYGVRAPAVPPPLGGGGVGPRLILGWGVAIPGGGGVGPKNPPRVWCVLAGGRRGQARANDVTAFWEKICNLLVNSRAALTTHL